MLISDHGILELIVQGEFSILPIEPHDIQPASIDIHMGGQVKRQLKSGFPVSLDTPPVFDTPWDDITFTLYPGEFYLGNTLETFRLGPNVAMKLEGKSTWGRMGLMVHSTAGWIDPGFDGEITLELKVIGVDPVTINLGDPIAQVSVHQLDQPCDRPYGPARGSHYQGQTGATEVKLHG